MIPPYTTYDRVAIPEDVPEAGLSRGDVGLVEGLALRDNVVTATVRVDLSTGRPRCRVRMTVGGEERVLSCAPA